MTVREKWLAALGALALVAVFLAPPAPHKDNPDTEPPTLGVFLLSPEIAQAATWQGDQYGLPNFSGYPMPLDCYDYQDENRNWGLPDCRSYDIIAEFSVHQAGTGSGHTKYVRASSMSGQPGHWGLYPYGCCGGEGSLGYAVSIPYGASVTLEWSGQPYQTSTHHHCSMTDGYNNCINTYGQSVTTYFFQNGTNYGGTAGSVNVTPASSQTYSMTFSGSAGSYTLSIPVTVDTSCPSGYSGSQPNCIPPPTPCTSAPNACGMTSSGWQPYGGSCDAVTPPNSSCPATSASISASPTSVYSGQSSTITWSSQNATSCSVSGPGVSSSTLSGSQGTGALTAGTKTYTINCSGVGGSVSNSTAVTVNSIPSGCSGSFCTVGCTPSTVLSGGATSCTWSCNPSIYSSSQGSGFSTGGALSGSKTINPTQSTTYGIACIASGGTTSGSSSVTVNQPQLSITALPSRVQKGTSSTVTWSATNVEEDSCSVTSNIGGSWSGDSGSQQVTITAQTTFTISCEVPSGEVSQSTVINLKPLYKEIGE